MVRVLESGLPEIYSVAREYAIEVADGRVEKVRHPSQSFHSHNRYEIYYIYAGERIMCFAGEKTYHLHAGDLVLIPPQTGHSTRYCKGSHDRIVLNFDPRMVHTAVEKIGDYDLLQLFFPSEQVIRMPDRKREMVENILRNIHGELIDRQTGYQWLIEEYIQSLLVQIVRSRPYAAAPVTGKAAHGAGKDYMYRIVDFVSQNYYEDLSLSVLSTLFYTHAVIISREFKRLTGMNFVEFLNVKRVESAKNLLLRDTQMPVAQVASRVGYNSATYFERRFKRVYGCTPAQYRKRFLQEDLYPGGQSPHGGTDGIYGGGLPAAGESPHDPDQRGVYS